MLLLLLFEALIVSLEEAWKDLRILVLFSGDVCLKTSFLAFWAAEELLLWPSFEVAETEAGPDSLVFLCGEGEIDLFRSNTFNGEEFLD